MNSKKGNKNELQKMIFISLLLLILSVFAVSAADIDDNHVTDLSDVDDSLVIGDSFLESSQSQDSEVLGASTGTFDDLQVEINNAPSGSVLNLIRDYNGHYGSRIQFNKDLTIDGQGHTLNCLDEGGCSAFYSSSGNIVLKNLKIVNGHNDNTDKGGAIYITGPAQYTLENCRFENNWADDYGGPQTLEISIEGNKDVVADQIVKVSFNSKNYEAKTDGDGIARVLIDNIPSELGKYNITVNVYDKYVTSAVTVLSTIGGSDVAKFYGDGSQFEVRFTDKNGQYLNMGKLIGYQIDNLRTKYSPILNNEGIFDIDISSLGVGEHNITVFNLLTKENTTFTITILPGFGNENNHNNIPQSNSPSKDYSGNVNSFDSNSLTGDLFYDYSLASDNLNATDEVAGDKGNVTNHSTNSPVSKAIDNTQSNGGNNNLWWIILAILAVIAAGAIIKKYKE